MQLKKISEILSRLIDVTIVNTSYINDFTVGSTIRSIYEAVAMELESYYVLTRENITWGIQEGVLEAFDFKRRQAKRAYGNLNIIFSSTVGSDFIIPKGTTFESSLAGYNGVATFETIEAYQVKKGAIDATIEVYCTQSGTVGNFPRNTINRILNSMSNIKSVINEEDFLTGSEEESMDDLKKRFRAYVETRSRATCTALDYGARTVEDIAGVYVYEQVGLVTLYCHDNNGNLSDELKEKVELAEEEYRPAGIKLVVEPVTRLALDLIIGVSMDSQYISDTMNARIKLAVTNLLNQKQVGNNYVEAEIVQLIMNLDDSIVTDVRPNVTTSAGTYSEGELLVAPNQLIRAGDIQINLTETVV
jgi:hypothetical protein